MSKSHLRKDKTCLNCRHVVEQRFCPNCGQENTESRKTFHHLFIHFFEDLTHYENAFWRTIKNLLFKPSSLTKEYLSGKRLSYLAPVRLYIFISFITFFLITVIPNSEDHLIKAKQTTTTPVIDKNGNKKDSIISTTTGLSKIIAKQEAEENERDTANYNFKDNDSSWIFSSRFKSVAQLDSVQKLGPASKRMSALKYWFERKALLVTKNNTNTEIIEKFKESFVHNFSKVLFIYMPIFAFFLWLFHGKKRWFYFDHGIFTLHYFSFLLLMVLLLFLVDLLLTSFGESSVITVINTGLHIVGFVWMFYYFFPAHHRFYGESRMISFIKSIALFVINSLLIILILVMFAVYTFINLH
jgi:hypothetical protein